MKRALLFLLLTFLFPAPLWAHQTGKATFVVHVKPESNQIDTLLSCPALDVAHAAKIDLGADAELGLDDAFKHWTQLGFYLDKHIFVTNNGKTCQPIEHKLSPRGDAQVFWFLKAVQCDDPLGEVVIHNDAMTETEGGYRHIGRIQLGESVQTTIFTAQTPTFTVPVGPATEPQPEVETSMGRFLVEGITHILIGLDHVLFVLALVLMSRRLRELLIVVTTFTVAHSITLGLAALDVVTLSPAVVEPIIALSIVWMAVEALLNREESKRAYVATFVLGLVHGFGFSYVLRDEVGLPTDALLPALLSFNVGVEIGQLGIVLLAYPLRHLMRERTWERKAVIGIAGAIGLLALYWFVERTFLA